MTYTIYLFIFLIWWEAAERYTKNEDNLILDERRNFETMLYMFLIHIEIKEYQGILVRLQTFSFFLLFNQEVNMVNILTYWRFQHTSFCSKRKLVQATKFFISRATFPASLSNTYFCIDSAVPAHKNVLSLASSSMLNSSSDDIGSLEGLA